MKTIEAKLIICKNNETIKEIFIQPTIEDTWDGDKVREFIRETAKLKNDDFSIVDLTNPKKPFVSASHFLKLDPSNSNYSFRIEINDRNDKTPKFVFSSNATIFHENDEFARNCLKLSINLAERLMATDSYARQLKVLNQDIHKFSEMLSTTEVFYYNFNQYQEEEAKERETYDSSTEGNGNGLSLEVMQAAAKMVEEWSKNNWIDERMKVYKADLKKKLEEEVKEKKLKCPNREIGSILSRLSRTQEKEWRQKAETEWNKKREGKNENEEDKIENSHKDSLEETDKEKKLDDDTPLAWTKRRTGNHCKTIYMNDIFIKRLKIIKEEYAEFNIEDDTECLIIIVAQAFAIIHETAHLSLRWRGFLNTQCCIPNQSEAGEYLESSFFNFLFSLLVERVINGIEYPWDESQTIKGIGVFNYDNKSRVIRNVEEVYIKQVCEAMIMRNDELLDDLTFYPIQCSKRGHEFGNNVAVTKGKDDYYCNDNTSDSFYEAKEAENIRPVRTCGLK